MGFLSNQVTFKPVSSPLQRSIRFFRFPIPTYPSTFLAIGLTFSGGIWGFHVPPIKQRNRLGPIYTPVTLMLACRIAFIPTTWSLTFWFKPISAFGLFRLNGAYDRLLMLPLLLNLVSMPPGTSSLAYSLTV